MVIAVVAGKGGVGKSQLALLLYESLRQAGRSVELRDWDRQGTTTKSLAHIHPNREVVQSPDVEIYDTPPDLTRTATLTAIRSADLILIVATPSPADVWEAEGAGLVAKAEAMRKAKVRVVFNKVKRTTLLGRLMGATAKELSVPTLSTTISSRECYQHFVVQGWKALDATAREEVLQLTIAVLGA